MFDLAFILVCEILLNMFEAMAQIVPPLEAVLLVIFDLKFVCSGLNSMSL